MDSWGGLSAECEGPVGGWAGAESRQVWCAGVRWLLGVGRHWGKRLSSLVVYLDCQVVVWGYSLWFGGALHPVKHYVFTR